jgi:phage shock protein C
MIGGMNEANPTKRLIRTRKDRMVAGVCSGIAEYVGIDVTVVRLVFLALSVVTFGLFALVYLAGWVVIPEEGEDGSIAENLIKKTSGGEPGPG